MKRIFKISKVVFLFHYAIMIEIINEVGYMWKENSKFIGYIVIGSAIFAISVNLFAVPMNIYNMGVVGIAQIIRTLLVDYLRIGVDFDIAGIINLLFNIPLFLIAYKSLSKKFFFGTLLSILVQTFFFTLVPIPSSPIVNDVMANIILGGILAGIGIGLCLQSGASGGGTDIIGMYASRKNPSFSIGKISLGINACIYLMCAILFNVQTALYSIIYVVVFSLMIDKMHIQNIAVSAMIFTRNPEIKNIIMSELLRGVTVWQGAGAYTGNSCEILETIVSKYDVDALKRILKENDSNAFFILNEGVHVSGNYQRRLLNEKWVENTSK